MKSLLEVQDLAIEFQTEDGLVPAVRGVSWELAPGESLAIVGESGSGKSVSALALTRLLPSPPARYAGGRILFQGEDTLTAPPEKLRKIRGGKIAYIFQEPSTSLNPVYTIRSQIAEAIRLHRPEVRKVDDEVVRWLDTVGIVNPAQRMNDYPHQLSGGMQQRAMIAMALSCQPDLLVADEPTTALDVTIQAQILQELKRLRAEVGMALILITHNFAIIQGLCEKVAVMYRGQVVEYGPADGVLARPQHPYTKALLDCIPRLGQGKQRLRTINHAELEA
jgi:ABC-type dipeptide/oligopeptide/nickel transport system ATPase component